MSLFVVIFVLTGNCYSAIKFQAGGTFILDNNHKNSYGQYILMRENGNVEFTFDYDDNSQEFTLYKSDGSVYAIRKMLSWDKMLHKDSSNSEDIVFNRHDFYHDYISEDGRRSIYEYTPKAFNTFLENKQLFLSNEQIGINQGQVTFSAEGGRNFTLAYNNRNDYGKYILLNQDGNVEFTFDYDTNAQEFTVYKEDGSVYAIRKMLSWDKMLHKDSPNSSGMVYIWHSFYHKYISEDGNRQVYEHTPKAFNIILEKNGDLG